MIDFHVYIGYDPREHEAWEVCNWSIYKEFYGEYGDYKLITHPICNDVLKPLGYNRPYQKVGPQFYDLRDKRPFSTMFSHSRFGAPVLFNQLHRSETSHPWIMFVDCDFLFMGDVSSLIEATLGKSSDDAVMVVKGKHIPHETIKMDGVIQEGYPRKNWSSLMLMNGDHPSMPTMDQVNYMTGRELHSFEWLPDSAIGGIYEGWNYLADSPSCSTDCHPCAVHYTLGGPWFDDRKGCEYAAEWLYARDTMRAYQRSMGNVDALRT